MRALRHWAIGSCAAAAAMLPVSVFPTSATVVGSVPRVVIVQVIGAAPVAASGSANAAPVATLGSVVVVIVVAALMTTV